MPILQATVAQTVREALQARHAVLGLAAPLADDPPVFDDGLLDSLALAELVSLVEQRSGHALDMLHFDPLAVHLASDLVAQLLLALDATRA